MHLTIIRICCAGIEQRSSHNTTTSPCPPDMNSFYSSDQHQHRNITIIHHCYSAIINQHINISTDQNFTNFSSRLLAGSSCTTNTTHSVAETTAWHYSHQIVLVLNTLKTHTQSLSPMIFYLLHCYLFEPSLYRRFAFVTNYCSSTLWW